MTTAPSTHGERGFGVGLGILVLICLVSFVQISRYSARTEARQKSEALSAGFQQLEVRLREAEAQHAGFLASGEESFVHGYNQSLQSFEHAAKELRARIQGPTVSAVTSLFQATQARIKTMNEAMQMRAEGRISESRKLSGGPEAVQTLIILETRFRDVERAISAEARADDSSFVGSAHALQVLIICGTLLGLALVLWNRRQNVRQRENLREISRILEEGRLELLRANEEARASAQAKSDFLANISHEVRTPMNAISGLSQILQRSGLTDEQDKLVDGILKSTQGLLDVINPVLDISKIEHEGVTLDPQEGVDLRRVIEEAAATMLGQAELKGLKLHLQLPAETGHFRMDGSRLRQVLLNLIGNAIKFTDVGSVQVALQILADRETEKALRFSITDTGIGIPESARERLFQSFMQTDNSISRRYGGTGLGLAISKSIVKAMKGTIGFDSVEGQGTTFWFELALPVSHAAIPARARKSDVTTTKFHGRALIIEDNPMNQFVLGNFLKELGVDSFACASGPDAIAHLERDFAFDLFIIDVQMPVMDGFQVTAKLRADPRFMDQPIVACTAHAIAGYRDKCLAAGMNDYLVKPIEMEKLAEILARHLSPDEEYFMKAPAVPDVVAQALAPIPPPVAAKPTAPPPSSAPKPTAAPRPAELPVVTPADAPVVTPAVVPVATLPPTPAAELPKLNEKRWAKLQSGPEGREMVQIFVSTTPDICQKLADALNSGDWTAAEEHAHFLKSSASAMAFDRWTDQLSRIEDACNEKRGEDAKQLWRKAENEYRDLFAWLVREFGFQKPA